MGIFPAANVEKRNLKSEISDFWYNIIPYLPTKAGVAVDEWQALNITAFFACINMISRHMGSMPLFVYEQIGRAHV